MSKYTQHQIRFFAEQLMLKRPQHTIEGLASSMSGVKVDLTPHQVDAALFAMQSPLSDGVLLADEVGLGKTIEAGLVLAQRWSERKRRILLIVTASLRTQWRAELEEKFYITSEILETKNYNKRKKEEPTCNPFEIADRVVICSYNFASSKRDDIRRVPWDLVIMDEAHKLRNVYKTSNVMGNNLREVLRGRKKLLLTATPLQNNLMELYGLVSIIDEQVFGSPDVFREMYVNIANADVRNRTLRTRLQNFCKRTLRRQALEFVPYTDRTAITQPYTPTHEEEELYNLVSEYLQREQLHAFPQGQRQLLMLVVRKLLASSSMAIHGTLQTIQERLNRKLNDYKAQLELSDFDDYDGIEELIDEESSGNDIGASETLQSDCEAIKAEIAELQRFAELAAKIDKNSKGEHLLIALEKGFERNAEIGGARKAVIFTESKRTQRYLMNLLSDSGYSGQIAFLDGSNNDPDSTRIYKAWRERHRNDGMISGSIAADKKAAIVEEFKSDRVSVLIGTEAAAEGINLQFCNIVVNYDLPWNPQRIEQRIGRCHRYGQTHDVIVINFINTANAADQRVYELLDTKFRLFEGVFGSSDEVIGSIENGVDFENRVLEIYQSWRDPEDIKAAFDKLRDELSDKIDEKMTETRQSILENFDEDVSCVLKDCYTDTKAGLSKFNQWLWNFFMMQGAERVEPLDQFRFTYIENGEERTYNLQWRDAESQYDTFLRREEPLCQKWLSSAIKIPLTDVAIRFEHSTLPLEKQISFLKENPTLKGGVIIDKLIQNRKGLAVEEHLIISVALIQAEVPIDNEMFGRIMELPATIIGENSPESATLLAIQSKKIQNCRDEIAQRNMKYFNEECEKHDAYIEDLVTGLDKLLKTTRKEIDAKKKELRNTKASKSLDEVVAMKAEICKLEAKLSQKQRELFAEEDKLRNQRDSFLDEIRERLDGESKVETIMSFSFEII